MNLATPFKLKAILITGSVCMLLGCFVGAYVQDLRFTAKLATQKSGFDQRLKEIYDQAQKDTSAALQRTKDAQAAAAELDKQKTEELAHAQAENERLAADVAAGTRRVRIAAANLATCQLSAGRGAGSGSVGDAAQVELSRDAGRAILDIRAGIISDQAKLDYLQAYVRDVVRQCKR